MDDATYEALMGRLAEAYPEQFSSSRLSDAALSRPQIDEGIPVSFSPSRGNISPMASGAMSVMPSATGRASVPAFGGELSVQGGYLPIRGAPPMTHHGFSFEKRFAHGGEVEAALHAVRHHLAGGGFLSDLFSGPDYLSTGEVASFANMPTQDETNADFFKADRALRLAREVQAQADDMMGSVPVRAPLTAPRPGPVEVQELPVNIPFTAPERGASLLSSDISPASVTSLPLAYTAAPTPAPAAAAIDKLTARAPQGPDLNDRQRDLIIRTIAAETSGKTPEESQAIAHVILNRIQSGKYGATPEAVLFAKKQFEPWSNPNGANYPMRFSPESRRYGLGQTALDAALGAEDITKGATNFWAPKAQAALGRRPPKWGRTGGVDIGETRFHNLSRAEGGEVDGYAGGGDVVKKALDALRGGTKVFPKPQRMFPEGARPAGGEYLNAATGEAMTGQKPSRAVIGVTPEGKPVFLADPEQVEITGSPGPGSTKTKTNLFKQQAGWKWNEAPEGYENVPTIVSAENRGQHYYGLGADFPKGVDLERYANAASEPRLRPTTQGNVYPGEQVGSIDVRGREHPVYDMLTIRNMLAGTGAAGAASMPEAEEGYAHGGLVDDALHVVREHHADGEAVGMNQRMRDTIASIDPERSQDQPVMDPATMGEAWNRARQNYQNFPVQEGEAVARQFTPSVRQEIGAAIAGEGGGRDYGSELRRRAGEALVGSSGLTTGIGALDFVPVASQALGATDIAHDLSQGDYAGAAGNAALPVAMTAAQRYAGPIGAAGKRALEIARDYAKPIAGAAGTAAALSPEDAEAANVLKALKIAKVAVPDFVPRKMTLQEIRRTFDPHAGAGMSGDELERLVNAYGKVATPASLDPELARRGEEIAKGYITKTGSEYGGRSFFGHKPSVPLEELGRVTDNFANSADLQPIVQKPWAQVGRERFDSPMISLGGDLSDLVTLRGYGPKEDMSALATPRNIHAGFKYMRNPNPYIGWANAEEHAAILDKQVKNLQEINRAVKKDLPIMGVSTAMGPQSIDSSRDMVGVLTSAIEGRGIRRKDLDEATNYIRSGAFAEGEKAKANAAALMKDFPGFHDELGAYEFLTSPNIPGTVRGAIIKGLEKKTLVDKGFPEIGQLRYASSDPQFAMAPGNMIGGRMIEIDPALFGRAQANRYFNHFTYPGDTYATYYADVPMVHRNYAAPEATDMLMAKYNQWRKGARKSDPLKPPITVHPFSTDKTGRDTWRKMFEEQRMVQPINDRMLESIQRGEQRRPLYGFNKGGSVEDHALMLVSKQA